MAYEPTVWQTGDVVTSSKLNKLENAVANGGGGINVELFDYDSENKQFISKRTTAEILSDFRNGLPSVWKFPEVTTYGVFPCWYLIFYFAEENGNVRINADSNGSALAYDANFTGDHVIVSIYMED